MFINQKLLNAICKCRENKVRSFTLPKSDIEVIIYPETGNLRIIEGTKVTTINVPNDGDMLTTLMTMKWDEICNMIAGDRDGFDLDVNRYLVSALYDSVASELKMPEKHIKYMQQVFMHVSADNAADFMRLCTNAIITLAPEMTPHVAEIVDVHFGYSDDTKRTADIIAEVAKKLREESNVEVAYNDIVVTDFYSKEPTNTNAYRQAINELYKVLYHTGVLKEISFEYRDYDEHTYFACYKTDLLEMAKAMNIPTIALAIDAIEASATCHYTSAIQPGYNMTTYRDVSGCVSRVREVWYTQNLANEACYVLFNELHNNGNRCCIELLFKLMAFK